MRKPMVFWRVMVLAGLLSASVRAHDVINVVELAAMPEIDGRIEDELWGSDGWYEGFRSIQTLAPVGPDYATRFKVGYTQTHVVLAVRCTRPGIDQEPPAATAPGGAVWEDEGVEIFLAPDGPDGTYYQLIVNAWGTPFSGIGMGRPWNPDLKIGTARDAAGWTLELAVAFSDFKVEAPAVSGAPVRSTYRRTLGADGELLAFAYRQVDMETGLPLAWGFNIGRNTRGQWSYAPFRGGYHQPAKLAAMSFRGSDVWPAVFAAGAERLIRTDRFRFELSAAYRNPTDRPRQVDLRAAFEGADTVEEQTALIAPGGEHVFAISLPVEQMGEAVVGLELALRGDEDIRVPLRTDRFVRTFRELPIAVSFRMPYQRDVLYASWPIDTLPVLVRLAEDETGELGRLVMVDLYDAAGRQLASQPVALEALTQAVALPLPALEAGRYRVSVWSQPDGYTFFEAAVEIEVLPRSEQEWVLAVEGGLHHNGELFVPHGVVSTGDSGITPGTLRRLAADQGVNVHIATGTGLDDDAGFEDLLERHGGTGVYLVGAPIRVAAGRVAVPLDDTEIAALRARVRRLRGHEALMGWLIGDAPSDRMGARERLRQIAAIVREEDPYRPLVSLHDSVPGFRALAGISDIRLLVPTGRAGDPDPRMTGLLGADAGAVFASLVMAGNATSIQADDHP